jgi:hypothetical protein
MHDGKKGSSTTESTATIKGKLFLFNNYIR